MCESKKEKKKTEKSISSSSWDFFFKRKRVRKRGKRGHFNARNNTSTILYSTLLIELCRTGLPSLLCICILFLSKPPLPRTLNPAFCFPMGIVVRVRTVRSAYQLFLFLFQLGRNGAFFFVFSCYSKSRPRRVRKGSNYIARSVSRFFISFSVSPFFLSTHTYIHTPSLKIQLQRSKAGSEIGGGGSEDPSSLGNTCTTCAVM